MSFYQEVLSELDRSLFDAEELAALRDLETRVDSVLEARSLRRIGLLHWLSTASVPVLRQVAGGMGWPLKGRTRKAIVGQMLDHYRSASSLEAAWLDLSEADRNLLGLLALLTPEFHDMIDDLLETVVLASPVDWPLPQDPVAVMEDLVEAGYVQVVEIGLEALVVVSNGFTDLAPPPPLLSAVEVEDHRRLPAVDGEAALWTARVALRDEKRSAKRSFERGSDHGSPPVWPEVEDSWGLSLGGHRPEEGEVFAVMADLPSPFSDGLREYVREATGVAETGAARFYLTLALVLEQSRRPREATQESAEPADEALGIPHVLGAWISSGFLSFDELALCRERGAAFHILRSLASWHRPEDYGNLLAHWRAATVESLSLLLPAPGNHEGWVDARDFLPLQSEMAPAVFARPLGYALVLLFEEGHGVLQLDGGAEDHRRILEIWTFMWQGPMRWLGLVETACDEDGTLQALRLTPAGAAVCGRAQWVSWDTHAAALPLGEEDDLRWEDDLRLTLPVGRAGQLRALFSRWAELEGPAEGRTRYRLTPGRARSAFEAGHSPADLRAALERRGQALPASHGEILDRWWARRGLLHRYDDLAIVELASPLLQRELLADPRTASLILRPIGERALAVEAPQVAPLLERLEQRGYRPMVTGGET